MKIVISLIFMTLSIILGPLQEVEAMSVSEFEQKLADFQKSTGYYEGETYSAAGFENAYECHGYAKQLTTYIFGSNYGYQGAVNPG